MYLNMCGIFNICNVCVEYYQNLENVTKRTIYTF